MLAQTRLDHKGKLSEGMVNDAQLAIESQLEGYKVVRTINSDIRVAQSMLLLSQRVEIFSTRYLIELRADLHRYHLPACGSLPFTIS